MDQNLKCWEARKCIPSHYLLCPAYALDRNCWEVPGTRCKESHGNSCKDCQVYRVHHAEICSASDR
jgi:hypothetical protein